MTTKTETKKKATAKTKPINRVQRVQLQLLKLASFNEFNGEAVAASLEERRDLWIAFLLDRANYGYHYDREAWINGTKSIEKGDLPTAPIDLIRLRDLHAGYWNVDTLFILPEPGKEDSLELLVRREWNADEIDWYDPGEARHLYIGEMKIGKTIEVVEVPKMLRVWWD